MKRNELQANRRDWLKGMAALAVPTGLAFGRGSSEGVGEECALQNANLEFCLVTRQGKVTSRFFEDSFTERNTVASLMVKLGGKRAPVAGTRVSSAHLNLTTWPTDSTIAPGNRFSLVFDIVPGPGVHVYAPGAKGYRVVAVNIAPQPNVRLLPVQYPASQTYFFKPLNEHVPVFQKPFSLVEDVVLEATQQAQAALRGKDHLTLTGTLDYQACDDKRCFDPVSVPLSWTLSLRPLIRERPIPPKQTSQK